VTVGNAIPASNFSETYLFWTHLLLANLINGVTADGVNSPTRYAWGVTHPAAKIGGGFIDGYGDGKPGFASPQAAGTGLTGMILILVSTPDASGGVYGTPLTPLRAAQIDRKMDDGRPDTGYVQGWCPELPASCWGAALPWAYQESVGNKDAGVQVRIEE
jgi:hypothetical protein